MGCPLLERVEVSSSRAALNSLPAPWKQRHRMPQYAIAKARPTDLARLPVIELAAAQLVRGHAPKSVLSETTSQEELRRASLEGRLWVALADDAAVGFAHVEVIERATAHLEEIDVLPAHGRRGLGTRLVMHVCRWAAA